MSSNVQALKAARAARVRAPSNPLCNNDDPVDTISACRQMTKFLRIASSASMDHSDDQESFGVGLSWCLGMITDALVYAQELAEARDEVDRQVQSEGAQS